MDTGMICKKSRMEEGTPMKSLCAVQRREIYANTKLVPSIFDMKLSIYEFLYVIFSSSLRDYCFTSSA